MPLASREYLETKCFHPSLEKQHDRRWHAVFTLPQNEKSVVKHLEIREIESFLPTYETNRLWKNRQRKTIVLPLFPTYLFVRIQFTETETLQSPGVLAIVGRNRELSPIPDGEIEFLRSDLCRYNIEPFHPLVIGKRVRIRPGVMSGVEGTLVRKGQSMRFVLTLDLINQHAAIQADADSLEPVRA
jgi:transcription termination/antitermination protein NusG